MSSAPNTLPKELAFINQYRVNSSSLEMASWRTNRFEEDVWWCSFGGTKRTIDFRKSLGDGRMLTDHRHAKLLRSIKSFLCLQTHPVLTGSIVVTPKTAATRVSIALHVIDYFLLRSEQFQLAAVGFSSVSANDLSILIEVLTSNRSIKESIYEPNRHILEHLAAAKLSKADFAALELANPSLFEIGKDEDLALPVQQTLMGRAWLKLNDCYLPFNAGTVTEYRYRVNRRRTLERIVGHRVLCELKFDGLELPGFDVVPARGFQQELSAVPVKNFDDDDRAALEYVAAYVDCIRSMSLARKHGVDLITDHALHGLENAELLLKERTKQRARFTTLPFEVANVLLRQAITFYLEYGEAIVDYYLNLARHGGDVAAMSCPLPAKLTVLGVKGWRSETTIREEYFSQLRRGESLHNMLEVLIGAIAVLVNTLMARRLSEIQELNVSSIVEENGEFFLAFNLRKANVLEHRERAIRPLPALGAEALKLLARLSTTLDELGYPTNGTLFDLPYTGWGKRNANYALCKPDLNTCLNRFCDYHETSLDEEGRRYYVRMHQLRRNFAMLFFWHGSFGGVEVLRYFLGHRKPSMTYRYVTESVSGKALRRIKATVAKDLIKQDHPATEAFAQLICERYGLSLHDLHVLPERDVVDYVEDLLTSGEAQVEPEFFETDSGEQYRVLYRVVKFAEAV